MKIIKQSVGAVAVATTLLKKGDVIICPTDTVYGFLADAQNKKAVEKIYRIKKRPNLKPLSLFVKDLKMAKRLAEIDEKQTKVLRKYWPGKYTFVLKRKSGKKMYGLEKETIALRILKHVFLQKLLKKVDRPLVQTSVNISNELPLKNVQEIIETFGSDKRISLIINGGNLKKGKPSKVMDLTKAVLTRLR